MAPPAKETRKLLEEALKLPAEARAALAGSLIDSLDEAVDDDVESEWEKEFQRRIKDLESGTIRAVPWSEARRRILKP
jgi:putative addiction module component (TIGR02574 family)